MIRGSTPPHRFRFPVDAETLFDVIQITYYQGGDIILVKEKSDLTFTNGGTEEEPVYIGYYRLTQAETKLFRGNLLEEQGVPDVYIQVRALDTSGKIWTQKPPARVHVHDVLNDAELSVSTEEEQTDDT